jgi:hypothetical protein
MKAAQHIAVIGAGMAGIACARTLAQAGHRVTVLDKGQQVGGRMATRSTAFGSFDHGAQYFTVRDPRFALALQSTPNVCRPWSANAVRVLDARGHVVEAPRLSSEAHFVGTPDMNNVVATWALPLVQAGQVHSGCRVVAIERDRIHKNQWQLRTSAEDGSVHVYDGFDAVVLAIPAAQAQALLQATTGGRDLAQKLDKVSVAPCWTLMLAFAQASQRADHGPAVECRTQHHHHWLAGTRVEQTPPRPGRALDGAGQCRMVAGALAGRAQPCRSQAAQGLCRDHWHPRPAQPHRSTPLAARQDREPAGQEPSVGSQVGLGRVRRLVPGPPCGRRLCVGSGNGFETVLILLG